MPEILDHVAFLSQQVGPRPAGTEEEQQAALYIAETLQKEADLSAVIEDFNSGPSMQVPCAICCVITFVFTLLSLFLPLLALPSMVASIVAALFFAAEVFDRPIISKLLTRGVSQNVVAKYEPGYSPESGGSRRRKIVLVARYDSGKVDPFLQGPLLSVLPVLRRVVFGAMAFVPVLLVVRNLLFLHATGAVAMVFNVLTIIALVVIALPVVGALVRKFSAYNEGANCNASGVAVLMDVATRIGRGRVSEEEIAARTGLTSPVLHGEDAVRTSGLVPEGAQLVYEAAAMQPPDIAPQTPEARLAAAKAAVAALSGKPVSETISIDIADRLVQVKEPPVLSPTPDDLREARGEAREAFASIPEETMSEALANAGVEQGVGFCAPAGDAAGAGFGGVAMDAGGVGAAAAAAGAGMAVGAAGAAVAGEAYAAGLAGQSTSQQPAGDGVPDWFKKAQEKAKKPKDEEPPVQRSRYADALDAAVRESSTYFGQANQAVESEMDQRLRQVRSSIMEVKAPGFGQGVAGVAVGEPMTVEGGDVRGLDANYGLGGGAGSPEGIAGSPVSVEAADTAGAGWAARDPQSTQGLHIPSFLQRQAESERPPAEGRTANRVNVSGPYVGELPAILPQEQGESQAEGGLAAQESPRQVPTVARRAISLPDIGVPSASSASLPDVQKQRAPLAEAEESGKMAAKSLLTMLPSIDLGNKGASGTEPTAPPRPTSSLRDSLPSLSGELRKPEQDVARSTAASDRQDLGAEAPSVTMAAAFVPAGVTGTFAPVGEELLENVDPGDIYVDDADDSSYEGQLTETGAFAGPDYVNMPKSRAHRLLDRLPFGKRKRKEEQTTQEWLDVDDSFDARSVGEARGTWESFRQDDVADEPYDTREADMARAMPPAEMPNASRDAGRYEERAFAEPTSVDAFGGGSGGFDGNGGRIDGGGIGGARDASALGFVDDTGSFSLVSGDEEFGTPSKKVPSHSRRHWNGGAFSNRLRARASQPADEGYEDDLLPYDDGFGPSAEFEQIRQFRNPDINTEVWFVALGSELTRNDGMRAFLSEHAQDLRGSIIVELDALGSGALSVIDREGAYRVAKTSSRMDRYVKKASRATGVAVDSAQLLWRDSAASHAIAHGYQAMHIAGMQGQKPALFAQRDDILANVDEEMLVQSSDFVMELLKNI